MLLKAGESMNIYEVYFKDNGKGYFFDGGTLHIPNRVTVIVETERGLQFGRVKRKVSKEEINNNIELKKIVRIANKKDYEHYLDNLAKASEALKYARQSSEELDLNMKFLEANFTFDDHQLLITFYADQRVDFRELARRIGSKFRTRVELYQVGARDKAAMVGGCGVCGRGLCCATCVKVKESITIQMAKNQNLALNPAKINGVCGRLLCCLSYENDMYDDSWDGIPEVGTNVVLNGEECRVISVDVLNRRYKVLIKENVIEVNVDDEKNT